MKSGVRLAPAYPPEIGEPARAAPLEIRTTDVPGGRGRASVSLMKWNEIFTSVSQLTANSVQFCSCIGAAGGNAPAHRTRTSGWRVANTLEGAPSSVASKARTSIPGRACASCSSELARRATASTRAPCRAAASTICRPTPRLPPMTTTFLPVSVSILVVLVRGVAPWLRGIRPARGHVGRELPLECFRHTTAPAFCDRRRHGIGEDVLLASFHAVEDGACDRFRRGLRNVEAAGHVGVHRTRKDAMDAYASPGPERAQRLCQRKRRRLRDRVRRRERHWGHRGQGQDVDDGAAGTSQQWQEGPRQAIRAEKVHREVPLEPCPLAQAIVKVHAGIVDENIERPDARDRRLDLRRTRHVQSESPDSVVGRCKGGACPRIDPGRSAPESLIDECPSDAAVGARNEDRFARDVHMSLRSSRWVVTRTDLPCITGRAGKTHRWPITVFVVAAAREPELPPDRPAATQSRIYIGRSKTNTSAPWPSFNSSSRVSVSFRASPSLSRAPLAV